MNDVLFEVLKIVVMVAVLLITRYLVPWLKSLIDAEKVDLIRMWAMDAVLRAQQVMKSETGAEKKAIVTKFLKEMLAKKNISISDEQLDILIEAAVKQMKIEESAE